MLNILIVSSKYNQAGRNILNFSSILFLSERSENCCEIRIMPNIYQKQLNLWIRGWHSITDMNSHGNWLFRLSRAGRPIFAQKKSNCHCFRILTAWCLAFPGIAYRVTYIPFWYYKACFDWYDVVIFKLSFPLTHATSWCFVVADSSFITCSGWQVIQP
jgi:hypothetical protein